VGPRASLFTFYSGLINYVNEKSEDSS